MRFTRLDIKLFLISVAIGLAGTSILYVGSVNQLVQEKDDIEYNLKREISNIQREIVPVLESLENNSDFTFQDLNGVNP